MAFTPLWNLKSRVIEDLMKHITGSRIIALTEDSIPITGADRFISEAYRIPVAGSLVVNFPDGSFLCFDSGLWLVAYNNEFNVFELVRTTNVRNLVRNDPEFPHYTIAPADKRK